MESSVLNTGNVPPISGGLACIPISHKTCEDRTRTPNTHSRRHRTRAQLLAGAVRITLRGRCTPRAKRVVVRPPATVTHSRNRTRFWLTHARNGASTHTNARILYSLFFPHLVYECDKRALTISVRVFLAPTPVLFVSVCACLCVFVCHVQNAESCLDCRIKTAEACASFFKVNYMRLPKQQGAFHPAEHNLCV